MLGRAGRLGRTTQGDSSQWGKAIGGRRRRAFSRFLLTGVTVASFAGVGGSLIGSTTASASTTSPQSPVASTTGNEFSSLVVSPSGTLAAAVLGAVYSLPETVSGGSAPFRFSWQATSGGSISGEINQVPPGLSISTSTGTISGTPTKVGTYSFSVSVSELSNPSILATVQDVLTVSKGTSVTVSSGSSTSGSSPSLAGKTTSLQVVSGLGGPVGTGPGSCPSALLQCESLIAYQSTSSTGSSVSSPPTPGEGQSATLYYEDETLPYPTCLTESTSTQGVCSSTATGPNSAQPSDPTLTITGGSGQGQSTYIKSIDLASAGSSLYSSSTTLPSPEPQILKDLTPVNSSYAGSAPNAADNYLTGAPGEGSNVVPNVYQYPFTVPSGLAPGDYSATFSIWDGDNNQDSYSWNFVVPTDSVTLTKSIDSLGTTSLSVDPSEGSVSGGAIVGNAFLLQANFSGGVGSSITLTDQLPTYGGFVSYPSAPTVVGSLPNGVTLSSCSISSSDLLTCVFGTTAAVQSPSIEIQVPFSIALSVASLPLSYGSFTNGGGQGSANEAEVQVGGLPTSTAESAYSNTVSVTVPQFSKSTINSSCSYDSAEWGFVITGQSSSTAPSYIEVDWSASGWQKLYLNSSAPGSGLKGSSAHYFTESYLTETPLSAYIPLSEETSAFQATSFQFNLSHGPGCGTPATVTISKSVASSAGGTYGSSATVTSGSSAYFKVQETNTSSTSSATVTISDPVASGFSTPTGLTCSLSGSANGAATCTSLGITSASFFSTTGSSVTIPANTTLTITFSETATNTNSDTATPATLTNTASTTPPTGGSCTPTQGQTSNCSASATVTVSAIPATVVPLLPSTAPVTLSLFKVSQLAIVAPGGSDLFTISGSASGLVNHSVTVRDVLPSFLTIAGAVTDSGSSFGTGSSCSVSGSVVVCTFIPPVGGLLDPSFGTIEVPVVVAHSTSGGTVIVNIATASDNGDGAVPVSASAQVVVVSSSVVTTSHPVSSSGVSSGKARLTTTLVVPEVHTGKVWSSTWYWLLLSGLGLLGFAFLVPRRRRAELSR